MVAMTVSLPEAVYREPAVIKAFHSSLLERLAAVNGVSAAAAVNSLPLGGSLNKGNFQIEGGRFPRGLAVDKLVVSPNYFRAMGIQLKSGRDFSPRDTPTAPRVAMISSAAAAALWPGTDPLGKRISESDHPKPEDWYTIVGVADDVRQEALTKRPNAAAYFPVLQSPHDGWLPHMTFVVRSAAPLPQIAPAMRAALHEVDPDLPVEHMMSMQDLISISGASRSFQARLLITFALLALALAAIGVYGVLSYSVATRTQEIGIRMALGAQPAAMLGMVLRRTSLLAGAGLALGTAASLFVTRVLEKLLFEVTPNDPATMLAAALVLGIAALAAGFVPARRAARVDPLVALRWE
jgi:putative ABC transport system permease protein